ncbi:snoRNA-binding rRNA-processing protein imp4 [Tieghemiomyces parasiticus]|uniref:U3 small nucleolar ribonucleoprotein protein IMP4 n=1 Tax=Tieghemiomyces parasiticus TaxID=78921 RepID=A0A9W8A787_9FUNG|nr:snoRNA-binding rRNA-processing protein imp4 [Tieghemiomyces parasiticus]
MIRRQTRLRREYLYRKALESKEQAILERRQELKKALEEKNKLPRELKDGAYDVLHGMTLDEAQEANERSMIDNEYARAGISDPKILITTSRDASSRLKLFAKEMRMVFPNAQKVNRGKYVTEEIMETCRANDVTDLIILGESKGQPDSMIVSHLPYGPTVYFTLYNVVLRHDVPDLGAMSEAFPHLIFDNFQSKLGYRIRDVLKYLFPVPKEDSRRTITFANEDDFISFRHHVYQPVSHKEVMLAEVGPRFEMRPYEIRLGTVEIKEADVEWVLRNFQRTSHKRQNL